MTINHDYSYIAGYRKHMRDHGFAHDALDRMIFRFEYTKEQQEANRAYAESHNGEEWSKRCGISAVKRSNAMFPIMEAIAAKVKCYQFDHEADKAMPYEDGEWELFFWCNDLRNGGYGSDSCLSGRDYSYFTLTFNSRHDLERQMETCRKVEEVLEQFKDNKNLCVTIRHEIELHDREIVAEANRLRPLLDGKRANYHGSTSDIFHFPTNIEGRLLLHDGELYFLKKRARSRGYRFNEYDTLEMAWSLGIS